MSDDSKPSKPAPADPLIAIPVKRGNRGQWTKTKRPASRSPNAHAPAFQPTEEQRARVWAAIAVGNGALAVDYDELARAVINPKTGRPINVKTLRQHFADELATARALFRTEIAVKLVNGLRTNHANTTAIFLSKAILGLRERTEISGIDDGPIAVSTTELSQDDRAKRTAEIISIAAARKAKRAS